VGVHRASTTLTAFTTQTLALTTTSTTHNPHGDWLDFGQAGGAPRNPLPSVRVPFAKTEHWRPLLYTNPPGVSLNRLELKKQMR
jgi:hypothetical protein